MSRTEPISPALGGQPFSLNGRLVPIKQQPDIGASASKRSCAGRAGRLRVDARGIAGQDKDPLGAFRKISGDQIIGAPAAAEVHLGSGGTYHITIGIERVQEARFIGVSVRLKSQFLIDQLKRV